MTVIMIPSLEGEEFLFNKMGNDKNKKAIRSHLTPLHRQKSLLGPKANNGYKL